MPLRLQTGKGKRARNISTQEFAYVMKAMDYEAREKGIKKALYVADNASVHSKLGRHSSCADLRYPRLAIPARSPDINKVAEHTIANVKAGFFDLVYAYPGPRLTARKAQKLLVQAFEERITSDSVAADAASLPLTLQVIAHDKDEQFEGVDGQLHMGSGGDWPAKRYR